MTTYEELNTLLSSNISLEEKSKIINECVSYYDASSSRVQEFAILWLTKAFAENNSDNVLDALTQIILEQRNAQLLSSKNVTGAILDVAKTVVAVDSILDNRLNFVFIVFTTPSITSLLKQQEKDAADIYCCALRHIRDDSQQALAIISSITDIYRNLTKREKVVNHFLKKCLPVTAACYSEICFNSSTPKLKKAFHRLFQTIVFGKNGSTTFSNYLETFFVDKNDLVQCSKYDRLLIELFNLLTVSEVINEKIAMFRLVMEAIILFNNVEDLAIIRLTIVLASLLGIEQKVFIRKNDNEKPIILEKSLFTESKVTPTYKTSFLAIWNGVLDVISNRAVNLSGDLGRVTCLQWFQAWVSSLLSGSHLNASHIANLQLLILLDYSIVDSSLSNILKYIYSKPKRFSNGEFRYAYEKFMNSCLHVSSRLQRVHKFIDKFISAISSVFTNIETNSLLPTDFLEKLSTLVTSFPSSHCINVITILLGNLKSCINNFKDDAMNTTHLQIVADLICSVFEGCRLLCHSLPQQVIESFSLKIQEMHKQLESFATLILMRPHVRSTMQPFLQMCLIWGEMGALSNIYSKSEQQVLTKDAAPSDLSPLLSFVNRDQWSVFAERIANFGDQKCNQLLMKLIVQKLRISKLYNERSFINAESCGKYLTAKLKSNVHGICIKQVMRPEEFDIMINVLSDEEAKSIVTVLYQQVLTDEVSVFQEWCQHRILLENKKFVSALFEVSIIELLKSLPDSKINHDHRELYKQLLEAISSGEKEASLQELINKAFNVSPTISCKNELREIEQKLIETLVSLPLTHIATLGCSSLSIIAGVMVVMDLAECLLPVFERLLSRTTNVSDCFDVGLCIMYISQKVADRSARASVIELMILKTTSTEEGVAQFKRLVSSLKKNEDLHAMERLQTEIHVYNSIRKCLGRRQKTALIGDTLAKQRKRLLKSIKNTLQSTDVNATADFVLLNAYAIELMVLERKKKLANIAGLNFNSYLDTAITGLKAENEGNFEPCINFLKAVLKCAPALRVVVQEEFVYKIWKELHDTNCSILWDQITHAASCREFRKIMEDVVRSMKASLGPPSRETGTWESSVILSKELRPLFLNNTAILPTISCGSAVNVWIALMRGATKKKLRICQNALKELVADSQNILPSLQENGGCLLHWMKFLHFCAVSNSVTLTSAVYDYILEVILEAPETDIPFVEHFAARIDILSALSGPRGTYFKEKVPLIFQAFKKLLDWLLRESDTSKRLSDDEVAHCTLAAFHLEKWTGVLYKRELGKEVVFFLAEIIRSLAIVTLYPPVKIHLNNSVFKLLSLTDEHSMQFLMRTLPPGSQQLLSSLQTQYHRFYKFKGKI